MQSQDTKKHVDLASRDADIVKRMHEEEKRDREYARKHNLPEPDLRVD